MFMFNTMPKTRAQRGGKAQPASRDGGDGGNSSPSRGKEDKAPSTQRTVADNSSEHNNNIIISGEYALMKKGGEWLYSDDGEKV